MSEGVPSIKRIIANTINEKAFGDPDALAGHIIDALTENGLRIVPEDTALGDQPFDELTPENARKIPAATATVGGSKPPSTEATSPTICRKLSRQQMRRGVGPFMSRSLEAVKS
jgi:hypothetical protein